jgi:hypothetical protein
MCHHYDDVCGQDRTAQYQEPRGFAAGSAIGDVAARHRIADAVTSGRSLNPNGSIDKNKRGQIEAAIENLANNLHVVRGLAERINGTMLGYDPRANKATGGEVSLPVGLMAQQIETLYALNTVALETRQLLENVAAEIGA